MARTRLCFQTQMLHRQVSSIPGKRGCVPWPFWQKSGCRGRWNECSPSRIGACRQGQPFARAQAVGTFTWAGVAAVARHVHHDWARQRLHREMRVAVSGAVCSNGTSGQDAMARWTGGGCSCFLCFLLSLEAWRQRGKGEGRVRGGVRPRGVSYGGGRRNRHGAGCEHVKPGWPGMAKPATLHQHQHQH